MARKSRAQADIAGIGYPSAGALGGPLRFAARELCPQCRAFLEPGPFRMQVEHVLRHGLAIGARTIGKQHHEAKGNTTAVSHWKARGATKATTGNWCRN